MSRCWLIVLVSLLVASAVSADEEGPLARLKNPQAKRALLAYQKSVLEAQKAFLDDLTVARKQLQKELEAAQGKAAKADQLDDAIVIRDIARAVRDNRPISGIQILGAAYGANVSWMDVTDKIASATQGKRKWSIVASNKALGDPAPGWSGTRTFTIRYAFDGKIHFKAVYEGQTIAIP